MKGKQIMKQIEMEELEKLFNDIKDTSKGDIVCTMNTLSIVLDCKELYATPTQILKLLA